MPGAFPQSCTLTARERILVVAKVLHGSLYVWGGNSLADGGLDCSGFAQAVLAEAGVEPFASQFPSRLDLTAQGLRDACDQVKVALPGDLAFYGSKDKANHVMLVGADGEVIGSSKGDSSCTSPDIAKAKGARVKTFPAHTYRSDFLGFGRLPGVDALPLAA